MPRRHARSPNALHTHSEPPTDSNRTLRLRPIPLPVATRIEHATKKEAKTTKPTKQPEAYVPAQHPPHHDATPETRGRRYRPSTRPNRAPSAQAHHQARTAPKVRTSCRPEAATYPALRLQRSASQRQHERPHPRNDPQRDRKPTQLLRLERKTATKSRSLPMPSNHQKPKEARPEEPAAPRSFARS